MKKLFTVLSIIFISFPLLAEHKPDHTEKETHHKKEVYPKKMADKSKTTRPGSVELLEPKAFSILSTNQVDLKWQAAEGADSYKVQVATDANFKWLVSEKEFLTETHYNLNGLESGKRYYWRVFAVKKDNDPSWTSGFGTVSTFDIK